MIWRATKVDLWVNLIGWAAMTLFILAVIVGTLLFY